MVLELNPTDAEAFFNRGTCYAKEDDFVNAIRDLSMAVSLAPEEGIYFRMLANTKYQFNGLDGDPCSDWQRASALGDKRADFSIKRYCVNNP